MSASKIVIPVDGRVTSSPSSMNTSEFWEHLWRTSGIHFVAFVVVAFIISGYLPGVGAPPDALVAFYDGHRARLLISAVLSGLAVLNLMWFAAALRAMLADVGRDGWGTAVTASGAALGGLIFLLLMGLTTLAYSVADAGNHSLTSALNAFMWTGLVLSSFPRAMLVMAGTFGLWRSGLISNKLFGVGVAAVVLVLAGGTTWMSAGFWAPDGAYSRFVSPVIGLAWVLVVSQILLTRSPTTRAGW